MISFPRVHHQDSFPTPLPNILIMMGIEDLLKKGLCDQAPLVVRLTPFIEGVHSST